MERSQSTVHSSRGGLLLAAAGVLISWFALVTYFLVVPRWPDLRDSGIPSVLLAVAGAVLGIAGLRRSFARKHRRAGTSVLCGLGILGALFLAFYIFFLSYQLPPSNGVVQVGREAPAFQLSDQDGRERRLQEFRGRPLFLIFFRGHW